MSPVSFEQIPSSVRSNSVLVEFSASRAQQGFGTFPFRILVVAQRLATGTVAELVETLVTSADDAAVMFGPGSQAHLMAEVFFQNNRDQEVWFITQDDAVGSTAQVRTIVVAGPATANGTIYLYVHGRRLKVGVTAGQDANTIAAAIRAVILANDKKLAFSSSVTTNTVTLTAKNKGVEGAYLDVRVNHGAGELLPSGVSITFGAGAAGATNPDISAVWPELGEIQYDALAVAYTDSGTKTSLDTELESRWGPLRMIEGHAYLGHKGTHSALVTLGSALNSKQYTVVGADNAPNAPFQWAAGWCAVEALHLEGEPARPTQTLEVKGLLAPSIADRFTFQENEILLENGISTFGVSNDGRVLIATTITTYQTNLIGAEDISYLHVNTKATLAYLRKNWRTRCLLKYSRHMLADDDVAVDPGIALVTPSIMRAEAIAWFVEMSGRGLVEGIEQFKRDVLVERNSSDPNRLDVVLPTDLVNQLRVLAVQIQFLL